MKKKHTLILLFMFVFTGVMLLGYTPVQAWQEKRSCSDDEEGTCLEIVNSDDEVVYIVEAYIDDDTQVYPGVNWPFEENGHTVFRYIGGVSQDYLDDLSSKPSAWSYIVFSLMAPPLSAVPPGAHLPLDKLSDSCIVDMDPSRIYYKLNPSVNFKSDAIFELHTPLGTGIDECGSALVIFSKLCSGGEIYTPKFGGVPFEEFRTFECGSWTVEVEYNPCTGEPENVTCNNGVSNSPADFTEEPYGYAEVPDHPDETLRVRSFPIDNMGPGTPGVLVCTDTEPVFLRGNKAWWCPNP
jgi:hypothetical protein